MEKMFNLESLNDSDKRALYATLAEQFGRPGGKHVQFTADEELVWDAINGQIGSRRNLGDVLAKCGREYTRVAFGDDVDVAMSWIDAGCGHVVTKTQRMALVSTAVECLAKSIGRSGAPVIHKTLVQQLPKLPWAVDRAFPGYQEAKLLDRIAAFAIAA